MNGIDVGIILAVIAFVLSAYGFIRGASKANRRYDKELSTSAINSVKPTIVSMPEKEVPLGDDIHNLVEPPSRKNQE